MIHIQFSNNARQMRDTRPIMTFNVEFSFRYCLFSFYYKKTIASFEGHFELLVPATASDSGRYISHVWYLWRFIKVWNDDKKMKCRATVPYCVILCQKVKGIEVHEYEGRMFRVEFLKQRLATIICGCNITNIFAHKIFVSGKCTIVCIRSTVVVAVYSCSC